MYEWSRPSSIKDVALEYAFDEKTVWDKYLFFTDVTFEYFSTLTKKTKICGIGKIVEIDETAVVKRKYNVG